MRLRNAAITLSVVTLSASYLLFAAPADPVVSVTGGQIKGRLLPGGAVFKGVPYAAPPVGERRWREPAPVPSWTGIRDAGEYGAPCAQADAGWNKNSAALAKEDCLFLNVWAPEWPPRSGKAVMFWIHGGGNAGGSTLGAGESNLHSTGRTWLATAWWWSPPITGSALSAFWLTRYSRPNRRITSRATTGSWIS